VKRYLVPMVLIIWIVCTVLGAWASVWIVVLIPTVIVQAAATVDMYRRELQRFK
jgi:hypothetical protein